MVQVTLMGRVFDVAPYKIGALREGAPLVEKINATVGGLTTLSGGVEVAAEMLAFISIGLRRIEEALTPEYLEDHIGFDEIQAVQTAFSAILEASGFKKGEAPASSDPAEPEAASNDSSAPSPSSSSPPA